MVVKICVTFVCAMSERHRLNDLSNGNRGLNIKIRPPFKLKVLQFIYGESLIFWELLNNSSKNAMSHHMH